MVQFELLHTQSDSSAGWKWMAWYGLMLTSVSLLIFSPSPQWCTPVRRVDERITESVHINTSTVRNFVLDQLMRIFFEGKDSDVVSQLDHDIAVNDRLESLRSPPTPRGACKTAQLQYAQETSHHVRTENAHYKGRRELKKIKRLNLGSHEWSFCAVNVPSHQRRRFVEGSSILLIFTSGNGEHQPATCGLKIQSRAATSGRNISTTLNELRAAQAPHMNSRPLGLRSSDLIAIGFNATSHAADFWLIVTQMHTATGPSKAPRRVSGRPIYRVLSSIKSAYFVTVRASKKESVAGSPAGVSLRICP
ncbi:hypothetical protein PCH_Pc22g19480 [Penicillium rubens Wisconsin 54-1255]|uniref:Uncharacterized protein n=1 Tax=Penicillium rubens (strain ATCC 28089 / DSM 1075 / NRRL 1951 / Wisconsin 54-1255) TaxID=500485 RepID=B6HW16_PENRW|nr:hypothetical protein PCH_Pc22g19480 [Penicillium rubens Wisconsin 54-1255]